MKPFEFPAYSTQAGHRMVEKTRKNGSEFEACAAIFMTETAPPWGAVRIAQEYGSGPTRQRALTDARNKLENVRRAIEQPIFKTLVTG